MNSNNHSFDPFSEWKLGNISKFQGFQFESIYNHGMFRFMHQYWYLSYYIGLIYVSIIFGVQRWMKNKSPYDLKPALFLWNSSLAIFSVTAFLRSVPPYVDIIGQENGFYKSICVKFLKIREGLNPQSAFWGIMFAFSKAIELGDTLFIVLRKRPLLFIHWYHHLAILIVSWTNAPFMEPVNTCYIVLNTGVHSFLYLYFAAKTIRLPVPHLMTKMLTMIQFVQIVIGFSVNLMSIYLKVVMGFDCARESVSIIGSCVMGISFVVLFGNLLYGSFGKVQGHQKRA